MKEKKKKKEKKNNELSGRVRLCLDCWHWWFERTQGETWVCPKCKSNRSADNLLEVASEMQDRQVRVNYS